MRTRTPTSPLADEPADDDLFGWKTIFRWCGFVLRAPLRHRFLSAAAFLAVFSLAAAALVVIPFRYRVSATLLAGYPQANALANPMERVPDAPTRAARDVLLRRENLRAILDKTDFLDQYLAKRPWALRMKDRVFEALRGEPRDVKDLTEGLLDTLGSRLGVEVRPEGTVTIYFEWWDAELAREVVDAAQESFLEARRASEVQAIGEAIAILEAQRARLESDIAASIEAFERKHEQLRGRTAGPPRPVVRTVVRDPELARLQGELATKQGSLAEIEGLRRQRVAELQAELIRQQTIYAADHPTVVGTRRLLQSFSEPAPRVTELQDEIREIEREIARRGGRGSVSHAVSGPYLEARLGLDTDDPRLGFERGQLEGLLRQHAELDNRIQGVQVEQETAEAAFRHRYRVVNPAQLPRGPIKPYPAIFVVGGLLGGIAFAFFAATAADLRRGRILERWQVEEQLDLPVLAEIRK